MLGVLLILASTAAYNGSAVLLATAARQQPGDLNRLLALGRSASGLYGIASNLLGWVLEVAALTMLPLTLARILNVAGLGVLLWFARWFLKESLGRREILGIVLIGIGIAAASSAPPHPGNVHPGLGEWALLFAFLMPVVFLPYVLRALRLPAGPILQATAAGLAYALSGILNKGAAYNIVSFDLLPLALFTACIAAIGLVGFSAEIAALRYGQASVVVPIVLALHTVVPIVCAPFLFGEVWPAGPLSKAVLGGGILLAVAGILVLCGSSSSILAES
ncbi:MAG: hypothetical protein H0U55_07890 [Rubrobacteraceae bacterium]|nr:hypothetical protein [Rubrobacteraceae bacterium]